MAELHKVGLTRQEIRMLYTAPMRGIRAWHGLPADNPLVRGLVVAAALPAEAVISGLLAGCLHRVDALDGEGEPIQVTLPPGRQVRWRPGLDVWRCRLPDEDIATAYKLRVTTPLRTCFDLMCRRALIEAVVAADALLNANVIAVDDLSDFIAAHSRLRGVPQARRALALADGDA